VAIVGLAIVVAVVVAVVVTRKPAPPSSGPAMIPRGLDMVVLGDSFTTGSDMNDGPAWPRIIAKRNHWHYLSEVVGGTGYFSPGLTKPFGKRVVNLAKYDADLLIIAAGATTSTSSRTSVWLWQLPRS
jgi:hypothetical protein